MRKHIPIAFAIFLALISVQSPAAADSRDVLVRVAVVNNVETFRISVRGKFQLLTSGSGEVLLDRRGLGDSKVIPADNGIKIDNRLYAGNRLVVIPDRRATVYVDGRKYRGEIDIVRNPAGKFLVINVINLEDYIKGVLYHEVSHRWPLEVIKAQAVAARTYALSRVKSNTGRNYDVTSDIYSQVYGGRTSEKYRTNIAANRTKDEVLVYKGKVIPAYFHATCGGHTEDASELWKHDLPPLKGGVCTFCTHSPHSQWKKNFRSKDVQEKLNAAGHDIGLIKDIQAVERNPSGRIRALSITDRAGKSVRISGKDFRDIVGPNLIKSNQYDVVMQGYYFDLIGKGWGHGVGMCQWGAFGMAQERYGYKDILQYYYPGTEIVNCRTPKDL